MAAYDNPYHMARLRWLDSTLYQDDGIVPPYTPLTVDRSRSAASAGP